MEVKDLGVNTLAKGTVVALKGTDLANITFVRSKLGAARKDELEPLTYYHFSVAGRSFTIASDDMDSVNMLMDKAQRKTIAVLTLEATERQVEVMDKDGEPTGEFTTRRDFRFVSVLNLEDYKAYSATAGEVATTDAKYAPKESGMKAADVNAAVAKGFEALLAKLNIPAAAPVVNVPQSAPVVSELATTK